MSCNTCTSKSEVPNGCKSNGNCGSGCGNKLNVFDWLANMSLPTGEKKFDIYEIRFKNGRKHFYKNIENLSLSMGDLVAVESSYGHDIGTISLSGELVKVQMRKKNINNDESIEKIFRKATQRDINIWEEARNKELETQTRGREIISNLGLKMKLSDVEYQGDGKKATFYYTADERVDFRELIRELASVFSIRVEMKQVGMRQEAARLGGIGSCGRELCCSTWLTDFRKVNTTAARYQQLSLNPLKLSGQCGKLKCCLNYELDSYQNALKLFPKQNIVLKTEKGDGVFVKMDIFKKLIWYTYKENKSKWFKLEVDQVNEIIRLNKNNELALGLEEYESDLIEENVGFKDAAGQDSLTRFDTVKRNKRKKNKKPQAKKQNTNQKNQNKPRNQKTKNKSNQNRSQNKNKRNQNGQVKK